MRHTISPNSDRLRIRVMRAYGAVGILTIKKVVIQTAVSIIVL